MNRWTLKNYSRREEVRRIAELQEHSLQSIQKEQKKSFQELKKNQELRWKDIKSENESLLQSVNSWEKAANRMTRILRT